MGVASASIRRGRMGNMKPLVGLMRQFDRLPEDPVQQKRLLVAQFCKLLATQLGQNATHAAAAGLPPRQSQTLGRLLAGDSEKQIAARLKISRHTVHVYVKSLYRRYGVSSRGELTARFISLT